MLLSPATKYGQLEIARIIAERYPDAREVRYIDEGYENYIALVDNRDVVRFPRNEEVWNRSQLEEFILSRLHSPLISKVTYRSDNPPYLVQSFLPGRHMKESEFRLLSVPSQQAIGDQIAHFAHQLHYAISVDEFRQQAQDISDPQATGSYGDHLREVLYNFTLPTKAQDELAKKYYHVWTTIKPSRPLVVHDDLHVQNLLFESDNLSGILDFGAVCVGTVEQELRQVYRLSDEALRAAAEAYQDLSGASIDIEAARTWAVTQELATYAREIMSNNTVSLGYQRAQEHLKLWFPKVF